MGKTKCQLYSIVWRSEWDPKREWTLWSINRHLNISIVSMGIQAEGCNWLIGKTPAAPKATTTSAFCSRRSSQSANGINTMNLSFQVDHRGPAAVAWASDEHVISVEWMNDKWINEVMIKCARDGNSALAKSNVFIYKIDIKLRPSPTLKFNDTSNTKLVSSRNWEGRLSQSWGQCQITSVLCTLWLIQWSSTRGNLATQETSGSVWNHFWLSQLGRWWEGRACRLGEVCCWHLVGRS